MDPDTGQGIDPGHETRPDAQFVMPPGGRAGVLIAPAAAQAEVRAQTTQGAFPKIAQLAWPGLLRRPDRHAPGYAA